MSKEKNVESLKNVTVKISKEKHLEFKRYLLDAKESSFQEILENYIDTLIATHKK